MMLLLQPLNIQGFGLMHDKVTKYINYNEQLRSHKCYFSVVQPLFLFPTLFSLHCFFSSFSSSLIFSLSQSDFTVELFRYIVWLQPCVCAAEWPLRAPVSDVALSMRRMSLTSVQWLSERVAPQPLTPHQRERERKGDLGKERKERQKGDERERRKDVQDQRRKRGVRERKGANGRREGDNQALGIVE